MKCKVVLVLIGKIESAIQKKYAYIKNPKRKVPESYFVKIELLPKMSMFFPTEQFIIKDY